MRITQWMTLLVIAGISARAGAKLEKVTWRIAGDLSEACSCSVPCSCNFGQAPSPNHFCWALFSLDIKEGQYGDVKLDGLRLAGAIGGKGSVWYVDSKASKEQADALKAIAQTAFEKAARANGIKDLSKAPPDFRLLGFKRANLAQSVGEKTSSLKIGNQGGFACDYIMGMDGKTPVKVENNWSWNITDGIKAKARTLHYEDGFGNNFTFKGTNANQGKFDWNDSTPIYFR